MKVREYSLPSFVLTLIVMSISMGEYTGTMYHGQWLSNSKGGNMCD